MCGESGGRAMTAAHPCEHALTGSGRRAEEAAAARDSGSSMTLLERKYYLDPDPGGVNLAHGYPTITPPWMREYQVQPNPASQFTGPHPPPMRAWQLDPRRA